MTSSPRILAVTRDHESERRFGLVGTVTPLLAELQQRGVHTHLLLQSDLGVVSTRSLSIFNHACRALLPGPVAAVAGLLAERWQMGRVAVRHARKAGFDCIHCHDSFIAGAALSWRRLYRRPRLPVGVTLHGFGCFARTLTAEGIRLPAWLDSRLRRREARTLQRADFVTVPTELGRRALADDLGFRDIPGHWQVIPHGRPQLRHWQRTEARARLDWGDELVVLAMGRFVPLKGFDVLLQACARIQEKVPHRLVLLGDGDRQALEQTAARLGLEPRPEFRRAEDVSIFLHAADLYVSCSHSESFGMANLEALSAGLAAICTPVGGVPDVVGDAARMVPVGNVPALAAELQELLTHSAARAALAERGRVRADAWPGRAEIAERYLRICQAAVSAAG